MRRVLQRVVCGGEGDENSNSRGAKTFFVHGVVYVAFFSYLCANFGILSVKGYVPNRKENDYDSERKSDYKRGEHRGARIGGVCVLQILLRVQRGDQRRRYQLLPA